MIRQLSIFAENKKGAMNRITQILADAGVNMNTLVTNDSAEFGIIRMLVTDTPLAAARLQEAGYLCHTDWVAAAEIGDECGSLNRLLDTLTRGNVNLDYLYVTYSTLSRQPVAILRTPDIMEVEAFLSGKGYRMLEKLD
ncbi:MAG: ACT domain-containing protein [Clostridiales bacterium]|nr:ACT domain-containing protein [Clostridiales bacterium]